MRCQARGSNTLALQQSHKEVSLEQCLESAKEQRRIPVSRQQNDPDMWPADGKQLSTKCRVHPQHVEHRSH